MKSPYILATMVFFALCTVVTYLWAVVATYKFFKGDK